MGKIKGWERNKHTGEIDAWVTTNRPYLNVWITKAFTTYRGDSLYEVHVDFAVPRTMSFTSKKEALANAYKIMRQNPNN